MGENYGKYEVVFMVPNRGFSKIKELAHYGRKLFHLKVVLYEMEEK